MVKRKLSGKRSSLFFTVPKRSKIRESRIAVLITAPLTKISPDVQLCSNCTNYVIREEDISKLFYLTNYHWKHICNNEERLDCVSCELVGNAMPVNTLPKATEEDTPGAPYPVASISHYAKDD